MASFFVGQRVRLIAVASTKWNKFVGTETKITGEDDYKGGSWILDIKNPGSSRGWWGITKSVADQYLEPILPEGHQPAELTVEELLPFLKTPEVEA